jgi:hypothetical protein
LYSISFPQILLNLNTGNFQWFELHFSYFLVTFAKLQRMPVVILEYTLFHLVFAVRSFSYDPSVHAKHMPTPFFS